MSTPIDLLSQKKAVKNTFLNNRCIIPANGFYAWKQYGKKRKVPHYFKHSTDEILSIAGIWEQFEDMDGTIKSTFKMLTTENASIMENFGGKMPVFLAEEDEQKFLDDYSTFEELELIINKGNLIDDFTNHSVSSLITDPTLNRKELIQPHAQVDQLGNYTLFD